MYLLQRAPGRDTGQLITSASYKEEKEEKAHSHADPFCLVALPTSKCGVIQALECDLEFSLWREEWGGGKVQGRGMRRAAELREKPEKVCLLIKKTALSENMFREK